MVRISLIFYLIINLVSCNQKDDIGGFGSKKDHMLYDIEPIVLTEYPLTIDSVIILKLNNYYSTEFNFKSQVSYSVVIDEKEGKQISHIDSTQYDVFVEVSNKKDKDNWRFIFSKKLKLLHYEKG